MLRYFAHIFIYFVRIAPKVRFQMQHWLSCVLHTIRNRYSGPVEQAYLYASKTLLDLLITKEKLMTHLQYVHHASLNAYIQPPVDHFTMLTIPRVMRISRLIVIA